MRAAIVCLLLSAVAVSADLKADIDDVASHLPMKEIISIGKQYVAANPSYGDGLRYVEKVSYEKIVKDFLQTKEGKRFIEYFNHRGIDAESLWLHLTKMTVDVHRKWLEPITEGEEVYPVITGDIMADYKKAVIADSDFFEAVAKKSEVSPEFANLVAAFKDPEFNALFYRVANSKSLGGYGGKGPEVRGFWKKVWKATKVAAVASVILG